MRQPKSYCGISPGLPVTVSHADMNDCEKLGADLAQILIDRGALSIMNVAKEKINRARSWWSVLSVFLVFSNLKSNLKPNILAFWFIVLIYCWFFISYNKRCWGCVGKTSSRIIKIYYTTWNKTTQRS